MAKGGYEKRRIQQKKLDAKRERRRARRRRLAMNWAATLGVIGLIVVVALIVMGGDDEGSLASDPTASPSPGACTTPGPETQGKKTFSAPPCLTIDTAKTYQATFATSEGEIKVALFAAEAPQTVNSFVFLAQQGFFDGSIFHRVIEEFGPPGASKAMIQGGDAVNNDGTGDPGYSFGDENPAPLDEPGLLAMANSGPGTNGSQFFILEGTVDHLNAPGQCPGPQGCHTVFGKVIEGLDIVDRIGSVETAEGDKPIRDIVIESITIDES